jgi:hypothetical protein
METSYKFRAMYYPANHPVHFRRVILVILTVLTAFARNARCEAPAEEVSGTDALIRSLLLATLPREYANTKKWNKTKPRWDGLHVSLDGLQIKTKRRWKEVNHGTWTRYNATLIDPEHQLAIRSENLRQTIDGRVAFDLTVDAKLFLTGRLSEWRMGVQLYSLSAEADATVRLTMTCEAGLKFDSAKFPPDVAIAPKVTSAQLDLLVFNLHSISDADGPLVRKLGDGLHDVLQEELDERRTKLVEKINRAIDKHSGKLRLSVHDLTTLGVQR